VRVIEELSLLKICFLLKSGVPPNSVLFGGTVPPNSVLFGGTVPQNSVLLGGTVPPNSFPLKLIEKKDVY